MIHRTELARRRARCRRFVETVGQLPRETVRQCNFCQSSRRVILSIQDRYGCPVRTALCMDCGLLYLVDRLTKSGYQTLYERNLYRGLVGRFKNVAQPVGAVLNGQRFYADRLATALGGLLPFDSGRLLDAGGSTGLVGLEFARRFSYRPVMFDPSSDEVQAARKLGLEAHTATVEDFRSSDCFDVILLCRTVEHLYDLRQALLNLRSMLRPEGVLYCDFSDFMAVCSREGPAEATSKIDHCFWLVADTAETMFRSLGFDLITVNTTMSPEQVGFLLKPCDPIPFLPIARATVLARVCRLLEIESGWEKESRVPLDSLDWVRCQAYRLKKLIFAARHEHRNHSRPRGLEGNPAQESPVTAP